MVVDFHVEVTGVAWSRNSDSRAIPSTMIYTHVFKVAAGGTAIPLDAWRWSVEWPFSGMWATDSNESIPFARTDAHERPLRPTTCRRLIAL